MSNMRDGKPGGPDETAVRAGLARVLQSPQFANSPRASRFLRFVVDAALDGRQHTLKEYVLGVEVFDRGSGFDPSGDTIVRVEAGKLRSRLQAYYRGPGRRDALIIEVPKGGYVPQFRHRVPRPLPKAAPIAIAVLPFVNLSSDPAHEYWSDGLTDELISILSRAARLHVISRTSAFAFKGKSMDVREIGRLLSADHVIEGSVRRQDNRVRIAAQLTEVATGLHLWSATLERELQDAWAVQEEVATSVVAAVHLELTPVERRQIGKRHTVNPTAFELYLRGRHRLDRFNVLSLSEAFQLFQRASAADPAYPLPLLGIARSKMGLAVLGVERPSDMLVQVKTALTGALELDPDLAEAHSLLASLISRHEWNWPQAERHYRTALRLAPLSAEVHNEYATEYLAPLGRFDEAFAENRAARELDPFSPPLARSYALILLLARQFPAAERECRAILQQEPGDGLARVLLALSLHGQSGRIREALAEYERLYAEDPSLQHEAYVKDVRAVLGDRAPAEQLLERLTRRAATEFVPAMIFAFLHLHLGRIEEAVTAIEQAYRNREFELAVAKVAFGFDAFRANPRFCEILHKLGFD